ncbi:Glycosyltransferase involved in cell wall bisynthesis [Desulfonatronum thiosulfatophilum]|uniref:Glycosyltransferase involved in cell wall bisynthesis n=1 Tax=Desulfonatronum thiosulfatophilum TaxID=617002 RepID=A0A1G6ESG5_9BACT|nr:glycosyltransferase family 2 protein [Desulfonatronum thiosulfatophilum]SDB60394.1 Glycosyltransferase involved in cell wall bisynthesis [Desulfonatronum thiosulfatophilum]
MSSASIPPAISCILPIYNEEGCLAPLIEELGIALKNFGRPYEIICVDDCSRDGSLAVLLELQEQRGDLRVIRHTHNLGQSAAFATGFQVAAAPILITMDADMQHDPRDIPALLRALTPDTALVSGIRANRRDNWVKRISSRMGNKFRNIIAGDHISDAGCTFRIIRRESLPELLVFNGMHRFLPTLLRCRGMTVVEHPINHRPRTSGVSKYGISNRLWRGFLDCIAIRWYTRRAIPLQRWVDGHGQDTSRNCRND